MQQMGYIHDMIDVKALILYAAARISHSATTQELYELCYQDEHLSYFDVCKALPELVTSGHMAQDGETYAITDRGRQDGAMTEDAILFTVRQRVENAAADFERRHRRSRFVKTQVESRENGDFGVTVSLSDDMGTLMSLTLTAPDRRQALRLEKLLEEKADTLYALTMAELLDEEIIGEQPLSYS